ncbi:signal peptidase I [Coleofasciculus chthonoplastes]|uniref:signal peptidase I n=1 Tax=Coleofasciculus chthonoplastes TaxID=64178 RepID=UPI0032F6B7A8
MSKSKQIKSHCPPGKEPWLAVNLSRFFPGLGQIYAGQVTRGLIISASYIALIGLAINLAFSTLDTITDLTVLVLVILGLLYLSVWNLFDAYRCVKRSNSPRFEKFRIRNKDPWLAVFLSQIIPGLGHLYLKKWTGILWFILFIISGLIPGLLFFFMGFVVYRAYAASPIRRERTWKPILIVSLLVSLFVIISNFLPSGIRNFVAESRYIPSGAMEPTLQINDRLLINKWSYHFQKPQRGDIVVFSPTEALKQQNFKDAFIKRIIGLPGEKVEVKAGQVYINDQPLEENYIEDPPEYTYDPVTVPPNSYFVLGDNRNNSYDSHYWGFVPIENVIGKATKRFWPPDRRGTIE